MMMMRVVNSGGCHVVLVVPGSVVAGDIGVHVTLVKEILWMEVLPFP